MREKAWRMATPDPLVTVRSGMQPDSLKLSAQLAMLKLLHRAAFQLEELLGDKSSGKTFYLRGIQGQVDKQLHLTGGSLILLLDGLSWKLDLS